MLQSIRELAHSWVVKGLMLFLIASFSIWGIGDIFRGNPLQKTVVSVGDSKISVQDANRLFDHALTMVRQRMNPNITAAQGKQMGLVDRAIENEVERLLIDHDIHAQGLNVTPKLVLETLAQQPQFRTKDGTLDKQLLRQILERQRMSEATFLQQSQTDMARQLLLGAVGGARIASQSSIDALYAARAQKRVLETLTIDATKIGGIPAPTDKDLSDYYAANLTLFTAPEYRNITIATLSADSVIKDVSVSEDQLRKEYESRKEQLATPERRDIVQVVLQDEAKAKELALKSRAGNNLSLAAKEAKETAIPLEQMEEKNLLPELSKAVFAAHEGAVIDPVKSQLGWHVVQVKRIIPAAKPSFESSKAKLREDMQREQGIESVTRLVNQLDDQLAAGHSLDDIADSLKLRLIKIPAVDATGLNPNAKAPTELPYKDEVLKAAFALSAGETGPVEDDKKGNYYVVRTDDVTPAGPRPFDTIKAKAVDMWKAHEQFKKAVEKSDKIAADLRNGKSMDSFKNEDGISLRPSLPLSQIGDTDAALPQDILSQAFHIKKGDIAIGMDEKRVVVARLTSVTEADVTKDDPRKNQIAGALRKGAPDELLDQYVNYLRTLYPVKTNQARIDRLRQTEN